jgi:hypothetical protein
MTLAGGGALLGMAADERGVPDAPASRVSSDHVATGSGQALEGSKRSSVHSELRVRRRFWVNEGERDHASFSDRDIPRA